MESVSLLIVTSTLTNHLCLQILDQQQTNAYTITDVGQGGSGTILTFRVKADLNVLIETARNLWTLRYRLSKSLSWKYPCLL